jgi:hypothetical protein
MALWSIFPSGGHRTRFSRTNLSMIVAGALKIGQIAGGGMPPTYQTMHELFSGKTSWPVAEYRPPGLSDHLVFVSNISKLFPKHL